MLAATSAALVQPYDMVGITTRLLIAAAEVIDASAAGIILWGPEWTGFDVLATTSHRAADLEAYQVQQQQGPCSSPWRRRSRSCSAAPTTTASW